MTDKPQGGNQYSVDPRQVEFLTYYLNPGSETYSNIYQSAKKAGYSESYAAQLKTKVNWLPENIKLVTKDKLVTKAKNNLNKLLDSADEKIQADITKFVAKTDIEFSEKQETTINLPTPILSGISKQGDMEDAKD
jgi:phage terminase small subunit